jgi:uncharacterized membrane protein YidH (DUF202 family)
MKPIMLVGLILIVFGVAALAYGGITYSTREKIIDFGPIKASVEKEKTMPISPIVGGVALACGAGLIILGRMKP